MCGDLTKLSRALPIDGDDGGISTVKELLESFRNDARSVAEKLNPSLCVSRYFNDSLPDGHLHLIVQTPISGAGGAKFSSISHRPLAHGIHDGFF